MGPIDIGSIENMLWSLVFKTAYNIVVAMVALPIGNSFPQRRKKCIIIMNHHFWTSSSLIYDKIFHSLLFNMICIFNESPRLPIGIERVAEETIQAEASDNGLSRMELALVWFPRVIGLMTVIASLVMMTMAWKGRKFVFHRLVLGKEAANRTLLLWRCVGTHRCFFVLQTIGRSLLCYLLYVWNYIVSRNVHSSIDVWVGI
jgi:hypothetical protein